MKKVLLTILSLVVVAALVVGGLREISPYPFMDKHERAVVAELAHQSQGQGQPFANALERGDYRFGQWNRSDNYYGQWNRGWYGHRGFFGTLFVFVVHLLFLAAGWALWKRGGRLGRWIGGLVIVLAVWPLLEMAVVIVVLGGVVYWLYRSNRKKQESAEDFAIARPLDNPFPTSKHDSLDQWEAKTRRELKNKKEEE